MALPQEVEYWSVTTRPDKLIKIGAEVVRHGRYITFQPAEVAVPRTLFAGKPAPDRWSAAKATNTVLNGSLVQCRLTRELRLADEDLHQMGLRTQSNH